MHMAKKRITTKTPTGDVCETCEFARWFTAHWNISLCGHPITLHCHRDPNNVIRGIFPGTPACEHHKPKSNDNERINNN